MRAETELGCKKSMNLKIKQENLLQVSIKNYKDGSESGCLWIQIRIRGGGGSKGQQKVWAAGESGSGKPTTDSDPRTDPDFGHTEKSVEFIRHFCRFCSPNKKKQMQRGYMQEWIHP